MTRCRAARWPPVPWTSSSRLRTLPPSSRAFAKHPARGSQETIGSRTEEEFKRILLLLRNHSSVDFSLTELHGGTVEASSGGVGQGSEFVVRLPTVVEAGTLPSRPVAPQCAPTTPLRILIVDDNRDSADMVAALLNFTGHETFTANDGLAAVEAAAKLDPDVIFLDIGLPVLNGYEAARRIREQQGLKRPPLLVALTGWGQDEDRRRSEEAGFDAHVVKPIDDAVLRRLLADLSTRRQEIPD